MRIATQADLAETAARHQTEGTALGYYNFLVGPTAWHFTSGLNLQYTDNVLSTHDPQDDFLLQPNLTTQMHWPVTLDNSLDISFNAGYSQHIFHSYLDQFFITSGSGFTFDIFVGECKINLHDQINITQNSYQSPGVSSGNQNLESLQNSAGTSVTWDLGKLVPNIGYDHVNIISLVQNGLPDTTSDNFNGTLGFPLLAAITVGAEAGGSLISYGSQTVNPGLTAQSATQWSAGLFGNWRFSDYVSVQLHGGYTDYMPGGRITGQSAGDDAGFYFSASITHRVNQWLSYTISAGRSTDLSSAGQVQTRTYVQFNPTYHLFHNYYISTPIAYQLGTEPGYTPLSGVADYDQLTAGITVGRQITKKLDVNLNYQYVREDSTLEVLAYTDDIIALNLTYQF